MDKKFQVFAEIFSFAFLPVNEISMALAYLKKVQEKINAFEKIVKFFDTVWNFRMLGPISMDLWNVLLCRRCKC